MQKVKVGWNKNKELVTWHVFRWLVYSTEKIERLQMKRME